jgi:hypothetical protein
MFSETYRKMNDSITPSPSLVTETLKKTELHAKFPVRQRLSRAVLIAACVCLLLVGSAWAVETFVGARVTDLVTEEDCSSFRVETKAYPSQKLMSPSVLETLETIQQQYRLYPPSESSFPNWWQTFLYTWEDCRNFLEVPLTNPLEDQDWLEAAASSAMPLCTTDTDCNQAHHCELNVNGDAAGNLQFVAVQAGYLAGDVRLSLNISFYTENYSEDGSVIQGGHREDDFTLDTYQLSDGQDAVLVVSKTAEGTSVTTMDAYFTWDDALYSLYVIVPDGDVNTARATMEKALDCF